MLYLLNQNNKIMKKFLLLHCLLTGVVNVVAQKISILGDSYSTFEGHVSQHGTSAGTEPTIKGSLRTMIYGP